MFPQQAPWTGLGSLQSDVSSIKSDLSRKADSRDGRFSSSEVARWLLAVGPYPMTALPAN